jgi:hypothetical protein
VLLCLEGEGDVRVNGREELPIALSDHVAFIILDDVYDVEVGVEVFFDVGGLQPAIEPGVRTEQGDAAISKIFASVSGRGLVGVMLQGLSLRY